MDEEDLAVRFRRAYWQVAGELELERLGEWERSQLTLPQLRVLFRIRRSPGLTVGELAAALGVTLSTASGLVGKLADRGLLARDPGDADRRQISLRLTAAGARLAGDLAGSWRPFVRDVVEQLGDRLDEVTTALEHLAATSRAVRQNHEEEAEHRVAKTS